MTQLEKDLTGKVALVTGANTGIGRVTALELARGGAHVFVACRSLERAQPVIAAIQSETGTNIELEDDGTVRITGAKAEGREKAKQMIQGLTREPEVGEVFDGKVTRIMSIGAFVEYLPGKEGLVRISEISNDRVNRIEDVVKVGDKVVISGRPSRVPGEYRVLMVNLKRPADGFTWGRGANEVVD